jgi:hypothetical protein
MALVFGSTGWFFAMEPISVALGNWWQARDYQATTAMVAQRTARDAEGTFSYYIARYRVNDREYETSRLTVLDNEDIDEPSNAKVANTLGDAFVKETAVSVWVSPRKPEIAIVSRDLPLRSLWSRIPMAIGFTIFSVAGIMGVVGCFGNFGYYRRMVDGAGLWLFSALWCGFIFPMLIVVGQSEGVEWVPAAVVGFFALVGALFLYSAVAVSFFGKATPKSVAAGVRGTHLAKTMFERSLDKQSRVTAKHVNKRGGFGGRGDKFDKD